MTSTTIRTKHASAYWGIGALFGAARMRPPVLLVS
jgi:hypothetical protein